MHRADPPPRPRPAGAAEVGASAAALLLALATAWHGFGVYFCLAAACDEPSAGEITAYRLLAGALAAAVLTALGLGLRRRAAWALVWHLTVAAGALAVAVLFAVPSIDWGALREGDPAEPDPHYVPCFSGSGDCAGG